MTGKYAFAVYFALDLARVYKTYQYLFETVTEFAPQKLLGQLTADNPYWTFQTIMDIESDLSVRYSFNNLDKNTAQIST